MSPSIHDARLLRVASFASVTVGLAVSIQSRINAVLAVRLVEAGESRSTAGFHTALISFTTGLVLLAVAIVAVPRLRRAIGATAGAVRNHRLAPWQLLGGVGGAWLVTTQGLTVPTLGVALFLVAVVAGQAFSSLGVDALGLGPAGRLPPTRARILGAVLAVGAVAISLWPRLQSSQGSGSGAPLLGALAVSAGCAIAFQQALNGHVSVVSGWPPAAAVVNFVVGTSALLAIVAVGHLAAGWQLAPLPTEPWLYLGGPIGVAFIAMAAWIVPLIGVLRFALASIVGQMVGASLLDVVVPQADVVIGWQMWAGAALTVVAVVVANRR